MVGEKNSNASTSCSLSEIPVVEHQRLVVVGLPDQLRAHAVQHRANRRLQTGARSRAHQDGAVHHRLPGLVSFERDGRG